MAEKDEEAAAKDVQARGWMLTIPAATHTTEEVRNVMVALFEAAVFQKEVGGITGYEHYQCYGQCANPKRWSTIKRALTKAGFGDAHFEKQWATGAACYRYCTKEDTRLELPVVIGTIEMKDSQGARTDIRNLKKAILQDGKTYNQVLIEDETGNAGRYRAMLRDLQEAANERKLDQQTWRKVTVNYLSGPTNVGKTRYIFDHYKGDEFYRITDYSNPWDRYKEQRIVVFDEFSGQPSIEEMLVWLDGYTTQLKARYNNRISEYTEVWVLSNLTIEKQYEFKPESQRAAFRRRFSHIYTMGKEGELVEQHSVKRSSQLQGNPFGNREIKSIEYLHVDSIEDACRQLGIY